MREWTDGANLPVGVYFLFCHRRSGAIVASHSFISHTMAGRGGARGIFIERCPLACCFWPISVLGGASLCVQKL